jgi:hypothetical protein
VRCGWRRRSARGRATAGTLRCRRVRMICPGGRRRVSSGGPRSGAEKKRSRGKQPGSLGAAMRWEVPDRTGDHYPQGRCACGRDLADAAGLGVARSYQQEEIPAGRICAAERHLFIGGCSRVHGQADRGLFRSPIFPVVNCVADAGMHSAHIGQSRGAGTAFDRAPGTPGGSLPWRRSAPMPFRAGPALAKGTIRRRRSPCRRCPRPAIARKSLK